MKSIAEEIGDLRLLDVAGLVERYEVLFGRPPRTKNRDHLWRRCAWKLQEQRFGGLSTAAKRRLDRMLDIMRAAKDLAEHGRFDGFKDATPHDELNEFFRADIERR